MRECLCLKCHQKFYEDDTNPNIHYSNPSPICERCISFGMGNEEDWFQRKDGSYYQKKDSPRDENGKRCRLI